MLTKTINMALKPLIVIGGSTGVGKSKLAVELALQFARGELSQGSKHAKILNADSMQVYKGLDILTNKIPETERCGVEHLLMNFKQPGEQYVIGDWVRDAVQIVCLHVWFALSAAHNFPRR
jgi:tRNA dimethylallyltransferase